MLLGYLGLRHVAKVVLDTIDTKPALIETVETTPAQWQALQQRVAAFGEALQDQKVSQELRLSADDLNALIANQPELKDLKNRLLVIIEGDRIQGKVSLPLETLDPKWKGRYLNGVATFKISLEQGNLQVVLDDAELKGKPLPAWLRAGLKKKNLAQNAQNDPKTAQAIQKFESIQIKDGAVILKNKFKEQVEK